MQISRSLHNTTRGWWCGYRGRTSVGPSDTEPWNKNLPAATFECFHLFTIFPLLAFKVFQGLRDGSDRAEMFSFKETNLFILRNVRFVYLKRWQFHSAAHWHRKCGRSGHHRTRQHSSMCPLCCYQSLAQLPKRTRGDILSISLVFCVTSTQTFSRGLSQSTLSGCYVILSFATTYVVKVSTLSKF